MSDRERLIDFLLGELPGEEARAVEQRAAVDAGESVQLERYREALDILRSAAAEGWEARRRWHVLRPALAAAAVLAIAFTIFFANGAPIGPRAVYEPDQAYGYLHAEETDAAGNVREASTVTECTLRVGAVEIAAIGSERSFPIAPGTVIPLDSEIALTADTGAHIDLPHGGILFLGPVSTVHLRSRPDGETALRLMQGMACTVVGTRTIHLAVDTSDLLLRQESGATLMRRGPDEIVCLRGDVQLRYDTTRLFPVPPGERLPAACANDPQTKPVKDTELGLDWYRELVYSHHRVEVIEFSKPLQTGPSTMLFLRFVPRASGEVSIRYGGAARTFTVRKAVELTLRLRFADLGPGPMLEVTPSNAVAEARLFEAIPR